MHFLQKTILDTLRYNPLMTYTHLMPEGIESSHFRYHLKQLMTAGLVEKNAADAYILTDKGQREVDYLSDKRTLPIRTPKVITYTLLTHGEVFFLLKKPKEPYRDLYGLIGGKVHFGEDVRAAAQREIFEKVGLPVALPDLCGVANIVISKGGKVHSDVVAYVHTLELTDLPGDLPPALINTTTHRVQALPLIPDAIPILHLLQSAKRPFVERLDLTY